MTRDGDNSELNQIKSKIQEHLVSSGNYELISKQLKLQLIESGWYDKVAQIAMDELNNSSSKDTKDGGRAYTTKSLSDLYTVVKPKAEGLIPNEVRENMLKRIELYLDDLIE